MVINQKAWQLTFKSVAGSIQLKKIVLVCFNSAVPNFKLKINYMIEFKASGNGLLEARGQYVDFELNCIIISVQTHLNSAVPNFKLKINNMIEFKARGNDTHF